MRAVALAAPADPKTTTVLTQITLRIRMTNLAGKQTLTESHILRPAFCEQSKSIVKVDKGVVNRDRFALRSNRAAERA
jgi:hypothetical protein